MLEKVGNLIVGTVIMFVGDRGYGKMQVLGIKEDVFFHIKGQRNVLKAGDAVDLPLNLPEDRESRRSLLNDYPNKGDKLCFPEVVRGKGGPAVDFWGNLSRLNQLEELNNYVTPKKLRNPEVPIYRSYYLAPKKPGSKRTETRRFSGEWTAEELKEFLRKGTLPTNATFQHIENGEWVDCGSPFWTC